MSAAAPRPVRHPLDRSGRPCNVLLLVTDQERARHLLPQGIPLPYRDRLMAEATVFRAAHTATNLCSMSRANLYTGRHAQRNGVWENTPIPNAGELSREIPTLGHLFQDAGYVTGYFGKWHMTRVDERNPPGRSVMQALLADYGFEESDQDGERDGTRGGWRYDEGTAEAAAGFMARHAKGDRPWLAAVNFVNPHDIMFFQTDEHQLATRIMDFPHPIAPAPDHPLYREDLKLDLPQNFGPATRKGKPRAQDEYQEVMELTLGEIPFEREDLWRSYLNYYGNCLRDVDRRIGTVLDVLEASGQADRTLVVYTSDHGEMAGVHGLREKTGVPYREVSNVPLWIWHPDAAAGATSEVLTSMIDVLPTILSGAGVDIAQARAYYPGLVGVDLMSEVGRGGASANGMREATLFQWTSLVHLSAAFARFAAGIQNAKTPEERARAAAGGPPDLRPYRGHMRGLFDGRYKFARYFSPCEHHRPESWDALVRHNDIELYDTETDPGETRNLVATDGRGASAETQALVERLNGALNALVDREIGRDDGSYLPGPPEQWQL